MYGKNAQRSIYRPKNPEKYVGDPNNIVARSSWERRFMRWCDERDSVLKWSSEETIIPYISPIDGKRHRYFVDFTIRVRDASGKETVYLIEIKPKRFTKPPTPPTRKTKRFMEEVKQWAVNQAKWKAATAYAKSLGIEFDVLTEETIFGKAK